MKTVARAATLTALVVLSFGPIAYAQSGGATGSTGSATSGSGATAAPGTSGKADDDRINRSNRATSSSSINTPTTGEPTGANNPSIDKAPDTASSLPRR
jgi:hypothetical protein